MADPKTYGSPTGYQPPDPNRQQKKATPASTDQVHDYLNHMIQADQAYHAAKAQQPAQAPRVRGSSTNAPKRTDRGIPRVEKALKDAGA